MVTGHRAASICRSQSMQCFGGVDGLIAALQGVVDIDDDNDPAPENVPVPGDQAVQNVLETE